MYDGRRRNKCKEVIIPKEVTTRNNRLDSYIQKNFKVDKPETTLPCILNTNYYKGKLQNQTEQKILNRLYTKQQSTERNVKGL